MNREILRHYENVIMNIRDINFKLPPSEWEAARRIQSVYLRHYTRRRVAARKITRGCHAWIWKPMCKDGTIGIRPRLDMRDILTKQSFESLVRTRKCPRNCGCP
jgi:hypothetical protein